MAVTPEGDVRIAARYSLCRREHALEILYGRPRMPGSLLASHVMIVEGFPHR